MFIGTVSKILFCFVSFCCCSLDEKVGTLVVLILKQDTIYMGFVFRKLTGFILDHGEHYPVYCKKRILTSCKTNNTVLGSH